MIGKKIGLCLLIAGLISCSKSDGEPKTDGSEKKSNIYLKIYIS